MTQAAELLGLLFQNLVYVFALVVLLELGLCYTIQTIADKQDLPHSWMAWVPLLQIHPLLRGGNASFQSFVVLLVSGIAAMIVGALIGPLGTLLALAWGGWMLIYMGRVFWNTAENRDVSGWIGLLAMFPGINLVAYPYIAFHDGLVAPSRVGVVLGLLLIVVPAYPEVRKARELGELGRKFGPMASAAEQGDQKAMARLMHETLQKMQAMEGFEASEGDRDAMLRAMRELEEAMETEQDGAAEEGGGTPAPVIDAPELKPISPQFECPEASRTRGAAPPHGHERWCERADPSGGAVRHGSYAAWYRNGRIRETGVYVSGKREGVWSRWNEQGGLQTQAEFRDGLQHGFQIDWDDSGQRLRPVRFANGEPVGR